MNFLIVLVFVGLAAADVSHLTDNYLPPRVSHSPGNYHHDHHDHHDHGSEATISRPVVSSYAAQPEITYSRQVNVVPSVQVIGGGYDSGYNGNGLIGTGGLIGNGVYGNGLVGNGLVGNGLIGNGIVGNGLIGNGVIGNGLVGNGVYGNGVYGNGLIGNGVYENSVYGNGGYGNGLIGNGLIGAYDSGLSGGLIGTGYGSGQLINGGLVGSGLRGLGGLSGGSNIIRTVSAPSVIASAPVVSGAYESAIDTQYGNNGGYVYGKKH